MTEFTKTENQIYQITGVDHLRIGIAAKAANNIDYSKDEEDIRRDEKALLGKTTGIAKKNIIMLNQVHEDNIVLIEDYPEGDDLFFAEADGMITNQRELCLVIRTADCVPVFAFDKKNSIIGAAHSGWRGCRLSISQKLVKEMRRVYSSNYSDIQVFILPSIGPSSYIVNDDVANFFQSSDILTKNDEIYLNLWKNIENSLIDEGIKKEDIYNAKSCTLQNSNDYYSYRYNDSGRNLNFGYIASI